MMSLKKSVAFLTLGCKVNSYESIALEEEFKNSGYEIKNFDEIADVYIVNTCTVTNIADKKSRQMLHKAKKNNPNGIVVAMGCYVQAAHSNLENDDLVDLLVGNKDKLSVVNLVDEYFKGKILHKDIKKSDDVWEYEDISIFSAGDKTRANLKIQDGCNQFCTYCIIPYVRGRNRSRAEESILKEATRLVENGFKEIVLTGIHIGSYGLDITGKKELIQLLRKLDSIDGDFRIRLGSIEPSLITEDFIETFLLLKKICPHFHLSLQSGSDSVLKRMNRAYNTKKYLDSVNMLKKYLDRPGITTDIIVGFPGETEKEFLETKEFVREVGFLKVHIFPYSKRDGTSAAKFKEHIDSNTKKRRVAELTNICEEVSNNFLQSFIGADERILIEESTNNIGEYYLSHTDRYIEVAVKKELLDKMEFKNKFFTAEKLSFIEYRENNSLPKMICNKLR